MKPSAVRATLALATVAVSAGIAVPVISSAQAPPVPNTITFQETTPKVTIDDLAPKSKSGSMASQGDRLVTYGGLYDTARKRLGTISGDCVAVGATAPIFKVALQCVVTYNLPAGQIVAGGRFALNDSGTLPIVGGSGLYAGVRGTVKSNVKPAKGFDDADVLTLEPSGS
jgi:hypothetical protein